MGNSIPVKGKEGKGLVVDDAMAIDVDCTEMRISELVIVVLTIDWLLDWFVDCLMDIFFEAELPKGII